MTRRLAFRNLARRALGDDLTAILAGGGTEIADAVAARNDVPIVLDHDQRVAQIAELVQGRQQTLVVARVQADGRFVQHVQHAAQTASQLAGQSNALSFAVRERGRSARQRQVVQSDIVEELRAVLDLAQQLAGDLAVTRRQLPPRDLLLQLSERQPTQLVDRLALEAHGRRIIAQAAPTAHGTLDLIDQVLQSQAQGRRQARGFFQGRIEPLELEAKERSCACARRRDTRRTTDRRSRA